MASTALPHKLLCRDGRVMTAETEGVVDHCVDLHLPRRVGDIIQIAFRIGVLVIDGGRNNIGVNRLGADGHFHGARRAEHVAGGAFGGTHRQLARMLAKNCLDRLRFADVTLRR